MTAEVRPRPEFCRLRLSEYSVYEVYEAIHDAERAMVARLMSPELRNTDGGLTTEGKNLRARSRRLQKAREALAQTIDEVGWDPPAP